MKCQMSDLVNFLLVFMLDVMTGVMSHVVFDVISFVTFLICNIKAPLQTFYSLFHKHVTNCVIQVYV